MSEQRRYRDEEIRRIFAAATTEPEARHGFGPHGALTLAELQEIGNQVGIPPERIAEAAWAIDSPPLEYRRWPFGFPIAVRRSIPLPRAPTRREWEVLVTELRETFDARGRVAGADGIYEWRNGNLHAFVEPTAAGYRLRMGTRKGSAVALAVAGVVGIGWSVLAFVGLTLTGDLAQGFVAPTLLGLLGAGSLAAGLLRLPRWARTRGAQMELIARRARALIASGTTAASGEAT